MQRPEFRDDLRHRPRCEWGKCPDGNQASIHLGLRGWVIAPDTDWVPMMVAGKLQVI